MNLYVFLLICAIVALFFAFRASSCDVVHPSVLLCAGFVVSIVASLVGWQTWNTEYPSVRVVLIVVIGIYSFVAGGIASPWLNKLICSRGKSDSGKHFKFSSVKCFYAPKTTFILLMVVVAIILERVVELYLLAPAVGMQGYPLDQIIAAIRLHTDSVFTGQTSGPEISFSFFANQGTKLVVAAGFFSVIELSSLLNCLASIKKDRRFLRFFTAPIALFATCIVYNLLTGSRGMIVNWIISLFVGSCMIAMAKGVSKILILKRMLIFLVPCVLAGATLFYLMANLVGRSVSIGIVEYSSFYFGAGIPSLEKILSTGGIYGSNFTFYSTMELLDKLGLAKMNNSYSIGWVLLNDLGSNVFTGFARYYIDYGYLGVLFLSFSGGCLSSFIYQRSKRIRFDIYFAVYLYMAPYLIDMAREEFIFSRMLSLSMLIVFAVLACILFIAKKEQMMDQELI